MLLPHTGSCAGFVIPAYDLVNMSFTFHQNGTGTNTITWLYIFLSPNPIARASHWGLWANLTGEAEKEARTGKTKIGLIPH